MPDEYPTPPDALTVYPISLDETSVRTPVVARARLIADAVDGIVAHAGKSALLVVSPHAAPAALAAALRALAAEIDGGRFRGTPAAASVWRCQVALHPRPDNAYDPPGVYPPPEWRASAESERGRRGGISLVRDDGEAESDGGKDSGGAADR